MNVPNGVASPSLLLWHGIFQFSTQKALQTVVAGQQVENVMYVDYDVIFMEVPFSFCFSQQFRPFHELGRSAIRFGCDTSCSRIKQPLGRPRFYFWRRRWLDATLGRADASTWLHTSKTQIAAARTTAR